MEQLMHAAPRDISGVFFLLLSFPVPLGRGRLRHAFSNRRFRYAGMGWVSVAWAKCADSHCRILYALS
jgi:hypothetical protein